jgi:hypothetical protein
MMPTIKLYTISRIRKNDTLYGPVHWSEDGDKTFCEIDTTSGNWYILTNDFSGEASCRACLKIGKL